MAQLLVSNRSFTLVESKIANGNQILETITNAKLLNDYQFNSGEMVGIIFAADVELPNKYAAAYQLIDTATGQPFIVEISLAIRE